MLHENANTPSRDDDSTRKSDPERIAFSRRGFLAAATFGLASKALPSADVSFNPSREVAFLKLETAISELATAYRVPTEILQWNLAKATLKEYIFELKLAFDEGDSRLQSDLLNFAKSAYSAIKDQVRDYKTVRLNWEQSKQEALNRVITEALSVKREMIYKSSFDLSGASNEASRYLNFAINNNYQNFSTLVSSEIEIIRGFDSFIDVEIFAFSKEGDRFQDLINSKLDETLEHYPALREAKRSLQDELQPEVDPDISLSSLEILGELTRVSRRIRFA